MGDVIVSKSKKRDLGGVQPARSIARRQRVRLCDLQEALGIECYATVVNVLLGRAVAPPALYERLPRFLDVTESECWAPQMIEAVKRRGES